MKSNSWENWKLLTHWVLQKSDQNCCGDSANNSEFKYNDCDVIKYANDPKLIWMQWDTLWYQFRVFFIKVGEIVSDVESDQNTHTFDFCYF